MMKNKKRLKKLSKKQLRARYVSCKQVLEAYMAEAAELKETALELELALNGAEVAQNELGRLWMMLIAWHLDSPPALETAARLVEEAERIEEGVRTGQLALPVPIDDLRGSVLP